MPCSSDQVRKAAVLSILAAVRAAMRGLDEERLLLEKLALRLDILASSGAPVAYDPEVDETLRRVSSSRLEGFEWVLEEICGAIACMGVECKANGKGRVGGGSDAV